MHQLGVAERRSAAATTASPPPAAPTAAGTAPARTAGRSAAAPRSRTVRASISANTSSSGRSSQHESLASSTSSYAASASQPTSSRASRLHEPKSWAPCARTHAPGDRRTAGRAGRAAATPSASTNTSACRASSRDVRHDVVVDQPVRVVQREQARPPRRRRQRVAGRATPAGERQQPAVPAVEQVVHQRVDGGLRLVGGVEVLRPVPPHVEVEARVAQRPPAAPAEVVDRLGARARPGPGCGRGSRPRRRRPRAGPPRSRSAGPGRPRPRPPRAGRSACTPSSSARRQQRLGRRVALADGQPGRRPGAPRRAGSGGAVTGPSSRSATAATPSVTQK